MNETFHAFAEGLIDYAGMFPPAELSLEEALRNYLRYLHEPEGWMLGRFLCPADRLPDLARSLHDSSGPPGIRVSAVVRPDRDSPALLANIRAACEAAALFPRIEGGRAPEKTTNAGGLEGRVEALEIRLPASPGGGILPDTRPAAGTGGTPRQEVQGIASVWRGILGQTGDSMRAAGVDLRVSYEIPLAGDWRSAVSAGVDAVVGPIREARRGRADPTQCAERAPGLKLRCGGVTAESIPSTEQVALVLSSCRRAGISFKATAGLHHPVRAYREEAGARMHGFLNVFGAALLAHEHALNEAAIRRILEEEDAGAFRFTPDSFAWRDLRIPTGRVRDLRLRAVTSFGSCSFDEPREDLRVLGILTAG